MNKFYEAQQKCLKLIDAAYKILDYTKKTYEDECAKGVKEAYKEFGEYQRAKVELVFRESMQAFYDDYSPTVYGRSYSLYNLLNIQTSEDGLISDFTPRNIVDPDNMTKGRGGQDLFNQVFVEGWHGGSKGISGNKSTIWGAHPSPGTPYYRKGGIVKLPGSTRGFYHKYGKWGRQAARAAVSPEKELYNNLSNLINGEMRQEFVKVVKKHFDSHIQIAEKKAEEYSASIISDVVSSL